MLYSVFVASKGTEDSEDYILQFLAKMYAQRHTEISNGWNKCPLKGGLFMIMQRNLFPVLAVIKL